MIRDEARLREVLGGPALAWLRRRLRARLSRGEALMGGPVTLDLPSPEERAAVERLFGRLGRGQGLRVDLEALRRVLQQAEICDDLVDAVVALEGPIVNQREQRDAEESRWRDLFAETAAMVENAPPLVSRWLLELEATGLLRRLAGADLDEATTLIRRAVAVVRRLPTTAVPLAELAASAAGDSHALDQGEPVGALVLRAAAMLANVDMPEDAEGRRQTWAAVGVLCDELSAPVLVLNLTATVETPTGRALSLHASVGEPYRLSTRQLLRHGPTFSAPLAGSRTVFVCENPTVVAVAANKLGARCAPLLCTEGQPKTAFRLLADVLVRAGFHLAYHGDFDWPGILIANSVVKRFGALPWRLRPEDYLQAEPGPSLEGPPVAASWDTALGAAMERRRCAVHEESVLDILLSDLIGEWGSDQLE
jgi:uncharacterized protein (TIGR02679 family)